MHSTDNHTDNGNTAVRLLAQALPALATTTIGPWAAQALCAQVDPEIFFPPGDDPATEARRICAHCPVRRPCLDYALAAGEEYGIWGGLDPEERRALRWKLRRRKDDTGSATEGAA
jgi:WhiB family redox-sensing transcriptional regulator